MMETNNGLLVRAVIKDVVLERSIGNHVLLFHPDAVEAIVLDARDCKQLAHALSCAYYPYGET